MEPIVQYDGKALIPAPFVSISKEYNALDDGTPVGSTYSIVLHGTLLSFKGSPSSSGTFWESTDYPPDESIDVQLRSRDTGFLDGRGLPDMDDIAGCGGCNWKKGSAALLDVGLECLRCVLYLWAGVFRHHDSSAGLSILG